MDDRRIERRILHQYCYELNMFLMGKELARLEKYHKTDTFEMLQLRYAVWHRAGVMEVLLGN